MEEKQVHLAVVGCGMMAQGTHLPNVTKHPGITLRWCCDINPDTLSRVAERFKPAMTTKNPQDVASDPECDGVIIATTHKARSELIRLFASAGKDIYVEKPMAGTLEELQEILRILEDYPEIIFCVGHNRRMAPAVQEALNIYRKHKKNPISPAWRWDREGDARPSFPEEEETVMLLRVNDDYFSWKRWAFDEGILISEMTHFADLACMFIEADPIKITVTGSQLANHTIVIEFADGSLATIVAAAVGSFGYPKELVEIYHKGSAIIIDHMVELRVAGVVDEPFRRTFPLSQDFAPGLTLDTGIVDLYRKTLAAHEEAIYKGDNSIIGPFPDKGHYGLLDRFVHAIRYREDTPCNAAEAAKSTAVILRALESVESGQSVKIEKRDYTLLK
jgi:predicted dehydrogenase